ncbi:MAG: WG repeat-containing protein [Butyrivibrio sp.]|jgi:hypothetical protein|nr:WG repeat-containing protein [Butyrivibrio sp.]
MFVTEKVMKKRKVIISVVSVLVIILVWFGTVAALNDKKDVMNQAELVRKANEFRDKGLYVRSYPLYEEALSINTENNRQVMEELLSAYYSDGRYGDYTIYIDNLPMTGDKPSPDNYVKYATILNRQGDVTKSIEKAFEGLAEYPEYTPLEDFILEYRYSFYVYKVEATEAGNFVNKSLDIPVINTNGEWEFCSADGYLSYDTGYEAIREYSAKGFCPVKKDGQWIIIDSRSNKYAIDETGVDDVFATDEEYIVAEKDGKMGYYDIDFNLIGDQTIHDELSLASNDYVIAARDGTKWMILNTAFERVNDTDYEDIAINYSHFPSEGGAMMLKENGKWYLCDITGKHISEEGFADAKAPEEAGALIAVANEEGRWGFIDTTGKLVIDYKYEDAQSFSCGLGAVMEYDEWDYIDSSDTVRIKLGVEELRPFHDGVAVAKNGGKILIINLYFTEKDIEDAKAGAKNEDV